MSIIRQRRKRLEQAVAAERVGFRPCPEEKEWIERTVTEIENNKGYRYEVKDPKRLAGDKAVYFYVKKRHEHPQDEPHVEEEILFALKRPTAGALVLAVKPSSLAPGLATRMIGAVATGPWDGQPDDLHRLDLPADLKKTNLLGALGPQGRSFYDLIDASTLSVVQGLGDVGGLLVRFRDGWCSVAGVGHRMPFRLDQLISRIRPLL
jgi:hypothetical protein